MIALKEGRASSVYLQELPIPSLLQMQMELFHSNGLPITAPAFNQVPLKWGVMPQEFCPNPLVDLFIAADCLYERNDFSDLIATAAFLMQRSNGAHWIMCYHDRNLLYSIDELFEYWDLKSAIIPFGLFRFSPSLFLEHNSDAAASLIEDVPLVDSFYETLYLLEICHQDQPFDFAPQPSPQQQ